MKKLILLAVLFLGTLTFTSCDPDPVDDGQVNQIDQFARDTEPTNDGTVDDEEDTDEE